MAWIFLTIFAALIQSIRTAAQKRILGRLSPGATYVRYLFALPLVLAYYSIAVGDQWQATVFSGKLVAVIALGGLTQIIGTWALIKTFATRNFAVGSAFSKTEAFQAALIGSLFLGIPLSNVGWLAIAVSPWWHTLPDDSRRRAAPRFMADSGCRLRVAQRCRLRCFRTVRLSGQPDVTAAASGSRGHSPGNHATHAGTGD